jgi:hypothetical protein
MPITGELSGRWWTKKRSSGDTGRYRKLSKEGLVYSDKGDIGRRVIVVQSEG